MPKHLRRRVFYILIVLFFVLGAGAVLYAQGWRPLSGSGGLGFGKVGAIYARSFPADAELRLDGEIQRKNAGIFDRGRFLTNLLPGEYRLEAAAEGYHPWRMQVTVTSTLVTTLRYMVLAPMGASAATTTPTEEVVLAGTMPVIHTAHGLQALSGSSIPGDVFMAAAEDGSVVLTYSTSTRNYLAVDRARATTTALGRLVPAGTGGIPTLSFLPLPGSTRLFLARSPEGLSLIDLNASGTIPLATTSVSAVAAAPGRAAWTIFDPATKMSLVSFYDPAARSEEADADSLPGRIVQLLLPDDRLLGLSEDGSLYELDRAASSRTRLAQNARLLSLDRNGDALAVLDDRGVQILSLRGRGEEPPRRFEVPDASRVRRLIWYRDQQHLFVVYPDQVAFLDLADARLENFVTVAPSGHTEYEPESNTLYFLKDDLLYAMAFPGA